MIRRAALAGSLCAVSFLALLAGALAGLPLLAAVGSVASYVGLDRLLRQAQTRPTQRVGPFLATLGGVIAVEQSLILVLVLRDRATSAEADAAAVVAVVVLALLRVGWAAGQLVDGQLRRDRILVRNLELPHAAISQSSRLLSSPGLPVAAWPGLLLSSGAAVAVASGSSGLLVVVVAMTVLVTLAVSIAPLPGVAALARAPRGRTHRELVRAALAPHAPVVVLYFGGGPGSVYAANTWLPTLERVRQSAFVLLRDPAAFDQLAPTSLPVVCAPGRGDVFGFAESPLQVSCSP